MSSFAVMVIGDPVRHETTNVGIIVFDGDGNYHSHRIAKLDRARLRGDLPGSDTNEQWSHYLSEWAKMSPTRADLERRMDTIGFAMSVVQCHGPNGSTLAPEQLLSQIYDRLIKE